MAKPYKKRFRSRREITRINERIRAPKVRVIDNVSGENHGVMSNIDAVKLAKAKGLDLVEVTANANPPVCKIVEYGKWKYEQSKQKKSTAKQKGGKMKEVKFRCNIEKHDYDIKLSRAEQFLGDNNKLRVQLMFRGRENAHPEIGFALMKRVATDLEGMATVDLPPRRSGRHISMSLSPLPESQRVRKFNIPVDEEYEDEDENEDEEADDEDEDADEETEGGEKEETAKDAS